MFAARRIAQVAPQACRLAVQKRNIVSGPPRVRISFAEKVAHGIILGIGVSAIPIWVLHHLDEYKGKPEEE